MTSDIQLTSDILISGDVNICLNGYLMDTNDHSIRMSSETSGNLYLESCNENTPHYFTVGTTPYSEYLAFSDGGFMGGRYLDSGEKLFAGERCYSATNVSGAEVVYGGIITDTNRHEIENESIYTSREADGSLTIKNVKFIGLKGTAIQSNVPTDIYNCSFIGNGSESSCISHGGESGYLYLNGCILKNNIATMFDACITSVGKTIVENTKITDNASAWGGAVTKGELGCFAEGTQISMADGSFKNIEDIELGDNVLTINHENGEVTTQEVCSVFEGDSLMVPFTLEFADGNFVSLCDCHSLLEKDSLKYVSLDMNNAKDYVGSFFYNADSAEWVELTSVKMEEVPARYYSIMCNNTIDVFANGMASVSGDSDFMLNLFELDSNLAYDTQKKDADIETYGILSYEEFTTMCEAYGLSVSEELFNNYNLKYLNIILGKGLRTVEQLINASFISSVCEKPQDSIIEQTDESSNEAEILPQETELIESTSINAQGTPNEKTGADFSIDDATFLIGSNTVIRNNLAYDMRNMIPTMMNGSNPGQLVQNNLLVLELEKANCAEIMPDATGIDIGVSFAKMQGELNLSYTGRFCRNADTDEYSNFFTNDYLDATITTATLGNGKYDYYYNLEAPMQITYRVDPEISSENVIDDNQYVEGEKATVKDLSQKSVVYGGENYYFLGWAEMDLLDDYIINVYNPGDEIIMLDHSLILLSLWSTRDDLKIISGVHPTCTADGYKGCFNVKGTQDYYYYEDLDDLISEEYKIADLNAWKTGDGKLQKLSHKWKYEAEGNKIFGYCKIADCPSNTSKTKKLALTLTATNANYSGSSIVPTITYGTASERKAWTDAGLVLPDVSGEKAPKVSKKYYKTDASGNKTGSALASAPIEGGKYVVAVRIDFEVGKSATAFVPYEIIKSTDSEAPKNLKAIKPSTIGGKDGKITGVTNKMEYSVDGGKTWKAVKGTLITGLSAGSVMVRFAKTDTTKPSKAVTIKVPVGTAKAKGPSAPKNLKAIKPSTVGGKNGKITGVTAKMEYSIDGGKKWKSIKGKEITGLSAGEVLVRVKSTSTRKAGSKAKIIVPEGTAHSLKDTLSIASKFKVTTGKNIKVKWGAVKDAEYYDLYMAYCGKDKPILVATTKSESATVDKLNKNAIDQNKHVKCYVVAYKKVNGKKVTLAKTFTAHAVGKHNTKATDAKKITLEKSSFIIKKGKAATIKAKTVKVNSKLPLLNHTSEFRYASSNKSIATISNEGKITAKKKGTCYVYVYAVNGRAKKVKVTVK